MMHGMSPPYHVHQLPGQAGRQLLLVHEIRVQQSGAARYHARPQPHLGFESLNPGAVRVTSKGFEMRKSQKEAWRL